MNWEQIESRWQQLTHCALEHWRDLTDRDWVAIAGKKDELVGRLQERYGVSRARAEKQAEAWSRGLKESDCEPSDAQV